MSLRSVDGRFDFATLERDKTTLLRGPTGKWCSSAASGRKTDIGQSLASTFQSFLNGDATLRRVGSEKVRGSTAEHYALENSTFNIWIDGRDRLVRMTGTTGLGRFSYEYFDFWGRGEVHAAHG
jgi:hypothetical protein